MHELIKTTTAVISGEQIQTVNARDLWRFLESKQRFADWIKGRINEYGFVDGIDYAFRKIMKRGQSGATGTSWSIDYTITLDMAKELAMVENNEKGKQARRYFIEVEKKFRAQQSANLPNQEILLATLYSEMEARVKAESERDQYRANIERLALASKLNFGEVSESTGLPKDIIVACHCKSSSRPHRPQYNRFVQLVLPMREIVEECKKRLNIKVIEVE